MVSSHAEEALKKLDAGQGINSGELDALIGERLIGIRDTGEDRPHFVITELGNRVLGLLP